MNQIEEIENMLLPERKEHSADLSTAAISNRKADDKAWESLFLPWILERGQSYADSKKVYGIQQHPGKVCAKITGQDTYDISISYNKANEITDINCTCPYAAERKYCKHGAAVLYTLGLNLKPLAEIQAWDSLDEESDFDDEEIEDDDEAGFDEACEEYVGFRLILGAVPDFDKTFNSVFKMIKSFVSNIPGAKHWGEGLQADRGNGEITIEEDLLTHDVYEAIFPQLCEEIAKNYPSVPFQGVADYSELCGDCGEVCLVRSFENKLSVLTLTSGCRLAICPECEADVMALDELAEILIDDAEAVLACDDCGAEYTPMELFADDWGMAPSWVINTYNIAEMPSYNAEGAACTQTDTLAGKTFVVTGDLYYYKNRDALKKTIEAQGGKLSGSVSGKTTALITNFPNSGTQKIKKAQDLGIEIITEEDFVCRYLSE